jgi:hypothetical protein
MDTILLDRIPFELDIARLLSGLHLEPESSDAARVVELAGEAQAIGRPKALYRVAYVDSRGDDFVLADGIRLTSRVLRVNLDHAYRIFPFVATCGRELEDWSGEIRDMLESYWAGAIKEMVLRAAIRAFAEDLDARFRPGRTSTMNPGSLADWPMKEQAQLFALVGDPLAAIGVELTDSYLMVPVKSVSGLRFPSQVSFENCQLCPREGCPGRRAAYDAQLFERRYRRPLP